MELLRTSPSHSLFYIYNKFDPLSPQVDQQQECTPRSPSSSLQMPCTLALVQGREQGPRSNSWPGAPFLLCASVSITAKWQQDQGSLRGGQSVSKYFQVSCRPGACQPNQSVETGNVSLQPVKKSELVRSCFWLGSNFFSLSLGSLLKGSDCSCLPSSRQGGLRARRPEGK